MRAPKAGAVFDDGMEELIWNELSTSTAVSFRRQFASRPSSMKGLVHRFYERVRTSWAARRRDFERRVSLVMRDIVRAPIIVDTATIARFFASSGFASSIWPATMSTIFRKAAVAVFRVSESARANSLPRAARGQPSRQLSRCAVERYRHTTASSPFRPGSREAVAA